MTSNEYGRVDAENNVFVIDNGVERQVGQYPGVPEADALAYFVRKFDDLDAQVRLLEQRIASGVGDAKSLRSAQQNLTKELTEAKAVGNLPNLRQRVAKLAESIDKVAAEAGIAREAEVSSALAAKEEIANRAEALIAKPEKINWKKATAEMTELFERWQALQKTGAKVPKAKADPLWKRFSTARARFESGRRAYFASLDGQFKEAKAAKLKLVEAAEALIPKGGDGASDYRKLQDQWKLSAKSGKSEDALWAKFRAAGDAIFAAKKSADEQLNVNHKENLALKLQLLEEAEKIDVTKLDTARVALASVQGRWESIGHVPKDDVRKVEDRLRKIEKAITAAEADHWRRTDPAAKARSTALVEQLEAVILKLEAELKAATGAKKTDIEGQLAARKAWLDAAVKAVD